MLAKAAVHKFESKFCFIIPCFNHSQFLSSVLSRIENYHLDCLIVDDGSCDSTRTELDKIAQQFKWVTVIRLASNQGKGAAVKAGINYAFSQGYTHGIQIDADGQHCCNDIATLIEQSKKNPNMLISGRPIYDDSVPKHRLVARYITHFWVWIETLSLTIKDSMCGFRVYPLKQSLDIINKYRIGNRMEFDTDIMVKLYWNGTPSIFIPTKVTYPSNGVSHFKPFKDNLRISWMHTRLFFCMLPRAISLIKRNKHYQEQSHHWSQTEEKKGFWGIKFILGLYRIFGRRAAQLIMLPVIAYFWLTSKTARQASKNYLNQIRANYHRVQLVSKNKLTSFAHFYRFGDSLLDKMAGWQNVIKIDDIYHPMKKQCLEIANNKQGIILIGSHLGDLELCRALAQMSNNIIINAIVFTEHAARFNKILKELNPKSSLNLIQVTTIGPDTAILLKQKLEAGEWIAIVGDRTSPSPYHRKKESSVIWADFLGSPAPFPKGPFILSAALAHPVYLIWGLKPNNRFQIHMEHFSEKIILPREDRSSALTSVVQKYAHRLEHYCYISPLDWFNFFDFWQLSRPKHKLNGKKTDD